MRWGDGKFVYAHLYELLRKFKISSKFSTNSNPASVLVTVFNSHLNFFKNSRMMGIKKLLQLLKALRLSQKRACETVKQGFPRLVVKAVFAQIDKGLGKLSQLFCLFSPLYFVVSAWFCSIWLLFSLLIQYLFYYTY